MIIHFETFSLDMAGPLKHKQQPGDANGFVEKTTFLGYLISLIGLGLCFSSFVFSVRFCHSGSFLFPYAMFVNIIINIIQMHDNTV